MENLAANCPFCNTSIKITKELVNQVVICPNCNEEVCFSDDDLFDIDSLEKTRHLAEIQLAEAQQAEAKRAAAAKRLAEIQYQRSQTEYRFIILEFDKIENTLNYLWQHEGWQVVSQSTVFLSENSVGIGGFAGSTRKEGIAYTLKREKISL